MGIAEGTFAEYDVILDVGGNRPLSKLRRALTPSGTLVLVGGEGGDRVTGGMNRQHQAVMTSPFSRQRLRPFIARERGEDLRVLAELIEAGKVTPAVGRTYALSETPEALRSLEEGTARGKLVVTVQDG